MKAIRLPSASRALTGDRMRGAVVLLALTSLGVGFQAAAQEPTLAVWKERQVGFSYRSSTAIYACSALQSRVASILHAIGARDDLQVRVDNCDNVGLPAGRSDPWQTQQTQNPWQSQTRLGHFDDVGAGGEQVVNVRIRVATPIVATPEVLAAQDKDRSRRELVARVTGNPAAALAPVQFPAQRQSVTLSRRSIGLEPVECELVEQMSTSLFRQLDVRVVRRSFSCNGRGEVSRIPPEITVEALMPVAFGAVQQAPAEAESDPDPGAPAASDTASESAPAATPPAADPEDNR